MKAQFLHEVMLQVVGDEREAVVKRRAATRVTSVAAQAGRAALGEATARR